MTCWLCGHPVEDPPEVIGHYLAGQARVAHRRCLRLLGELELDLRTVPPPAVSVPIDFGYWRLRNGQRRLLTWWPDCGAVTLDGPGGVDVLAVCHDEDDLRRRLTGWADHCDQSDGLGWVAAQLEGYR